MTAAKIDFALVHPKCLDYLPAKITKYLDASTKRPTCDLSVADAVAYTKSGHGDICVVLKDEEACGAAFFMYGQSNEGKIMDVAMLGGDGFNAWKKQIYDFAVETARAKDCVSIWVMGPKAWGKLFPDLQPIGMVYSLRL